MTRETIILTSGGGLSRNREQGPAEQANREALSFAPRAFFGEVDPVRR